VVELSHFQRGQIVGAHLSAASVTKTDPLLGISRAAVSMVKTAYTNNGKTSSDERNSGRKPKLSERDHHTLKRVVSKYYRTTAARWQRKSVFILKTLFPHKQSNESVTNPTSMVQLQLQNLLLLKMMLKAEKYDVFIKPGCVTLHVVPNVMSGLGWENAQGSL
jgi:hypothetical protein